MAENMCSLAASDTWAVMLLFLYLYINRKSVIENITYNYFTYIENLYFLEDVFWINVHFICVNSAFRGDSMNYWISAVQL